MADPLKLYYGRVTYAFLRKCNFCGKPYADEDGIEHWACWRELKVVGE